MAYLTNQNVILFPVTITLLEQESSTFNTVQSLISFGSTFNFSFKYKSQIFVVMQRLLLQTALLEVSLEMGKYQKGK